MPVIYRTYRPKTFSEIVGQEHVVKTLTNALLMGMVSHAYLFYGNSIELLYRLALAFSASINCAAGGCGSCNICKNTLKGVYSNIAVIEAEGNILRIDEIAKLQRFMNVSSYNPGKKICIIKELSVIQVALFFIFVSLQ